LAAFQATRGVGTTPGREQRPCRADPGLVGVAKRYSRREKRVYVHMANRHIFGQTLPPTIAIPTCLGGLFRSLSGQFINTPKGKNRMKEHSFAALFVVNKREFFAPFLSFF
jgi:hypothetical protein